VIPRAPGNGYYDSSDVAPGDLASGPDSWGSNTRGHVGLITSNGPPLPGNPGSANADPPRPAVIPGVGHLRGLGDN